jgi:hypothetical protein
MMAFIFCVLPYLKNCECGIVANANSGDSRGQCQ